MGSTAARSEGRTRSALEHRLSAGAARPHDAGGQLRGDHRLASAAGGEHQPAAGRARQRPDAPPVPAIRQSERQYPGDVEPISRAAGEAAEARVRWLLVSRVLYLLVEPADGAGAGNRRQLRLRRRPHAVRHAAPVRVQLGVCVAVCEEQLGCWVDGRSRRSSTSAAVCRSRQRSRGTWPTTASADSGRIGSAPGRWPIRRSTCGSTRPRLSCPTRSRSAIQAPASCGRTINGMSTRRSSSGSGSPSGRRIELRAEAFNLLNSVYFAAPNTVIDTAAGGRVTSTSNQARQIQLGVKYTF